MSELPDPKSWLLARIHYIRTLLMEITTPKTPSQEIAHAEYISRLNVLALDVNTDPSETKPTYGSGANTMEFKDLKASIQNIEHKTFIIHFDLCKQEAQLHPLELRPETNLEDRLCNINALLREAELEVEAAQQHEFALRSRKLISEARTNLRDIKTRHEDDIETFELDALWTSLDYAKFNTHMLIMAPYDKRLDIYTYELPDLKSRISDRIYITRDLLDAKLTSPIQIQNLPQELAYDGYIERSLELIREANVDILDIETNHRKDIPPTELENFKTSLHNIKRETLTVYNDLCKWKTSHTSPPAGVNKRHATELEERHSTSAKNPMPEQYGEETIEAAQTTHMCLTLDYEPLEQETKQRKGLTKDAWKAQIHQLERSISKLKTTANTRKLAHIYISVSELEHMTNILHGEISSQDPTPNKGLTIQGIRKGKTTATTEETLSGKRTPALPTPDRPPPQPPPAGERDLKIGDEPTVLPNPQTETSPVGEGVLNLEDKDHHSPGHKHLPNDKEHTAIIEFLQTIQQDDLVSQAPHEVRT